MNYYFLIDKSNILLLKFNFIVFLYFYLFFEFALIQATPEFKNYQTSLIYVFYKIVKLIAIIMQLFLHLKG